VADAAVSQRAENVIEKGTAKRDHRLEPEIGHPGLGGSNGRPIVGLLHASAFPAREDNRLHLREYRVTQMCVLLSCSSSDVCL
jgi:hypothetical protein